MLVLPPERWREMLQKLKTRSLSDPRIEALEQEIAENAMQVTPDKVGRICLTEEHARAVKITDEAELVGRLDKFEIWEPRARAAIRAQNKKLAAEVKDTMRLPIRNAAVLAKVHGNAVGTGRFGQQSGLNRIRYVHPPCLAHGRNMVDIDP